MFSDDSYVDLAQQGVFYNSIEGADDLASQRYGNHDDYFVLDCSAPGNQMNQDVNKVLIQQNQDCLQVEKKV